MATEAAYDRMGRGYAAGRRTDPRIADIIWRPLGDAARVLNVGAGTGNYEPTDRTVLAIEPSSEMLRQRSSHAASAVRGVAESLPFPDQSFDATLCVLTVHHWHDIPAGLAELRRVAPLQVIFMFDAHLAYGLWLVDDYFPEIEELPVERQAPSVADIANHLEVVSVTPVPVPADCIDGFAGAYWNRPEAFLRDDVRAAMSCCASLDPDIVRRGVDRLRADLESGRWDAKHGALRELDELDVGYRLVVARS
jgi:SAM-dependent methyltransferase